MFSVFNYLLTYFNICIQKSKFSKPHSLLGAFTCLSVIIRKMVYGINLFSILDCNIVNLIYTTLISHFDMKFINSSIKFENVFWGTITIWVLYLESWLTKETQVNKRVLIYSVVFREWSLSMGWGAGGSGNPYNSSESPYLSKRFFTSPFILPKD